MGYLRSPHPKWSAETWRNSRKWPAPDASRREFILDFGELSIAGIVFHLSGFPVFFHEIGSWVIIHGVGVQTQNL
jgi:hypothetical protein